MISPQRLYNFQTLWLTFVCWFPFDLRQRTSKYHLKLSLQISLWLFVVELYYIFWTPRWITSVSFSETHQSGFPQAVFWFMLQRLSIYVLLKNAIGVWGLAFHFVNTGFQSWTINFHGGREPNSFFSFVYLIFRGAVRRSTVHTFMSGILLFCDQWAFAVQKKARRECAVSRGLHQLKRNKKALTYSSPNLLFNRTPLIPGETHMDKQSHLIHKAFSSAVPHFWNALQRTGRCQWLWTYMWCCCYALLYLTYFKCVWFFCILLCYVLYLLAANVKSQVNWIYYYYNYYVHVHGLCVYIFRIFTKDFEIYLSRKVIWKANVFEIIDSLMPDVAVDSYLHIRSSFGVMFLANWLM